MRPITLDEFEAKFAADPDPWSTFTNRDEAHKRQAILRAFGPTKRGRVLELAAGNGSNSVALARRALRLDATEGTAKGTALVAKAIAECPRARALRLTLPEALPRPRYDAIVIAEVLYYLPARVMVDTARRVSRALPIGGRLVLAHHRIDFHDFVQHAAGIHAQFLRETGVRWRPLSEAVTGRWIVQSLERLSAR